MSSRADSVPWNTDVQKSVSLTNPHNQDGSIGANLQLSANTEIYCAVLLTHIRRFIPEVAIHPLSKNITT